MSSPLKLANKEIVANVLALYKGTPLTSTDNLPKDFTKVVEGDGQMLQKTFAYKDFKQAFGHFIMISKACHSFSYYPEMFNVYNRIQVKMYTKQGNQKRITTKDYYIALFLNEMHSKTSQNAHQSALANIKQIL